MRKITFILATALLAGTSFAQGNSESVESVLSQLKAYQEGDTTTDVTTSIQPEPEATPLADVTAPEEPELEVDPMEDIDVSTEPVPMAEEADIDVAAVMEESREDYAGGEFGRAQAGFESIIAVEPENRIARMYLRKILERDIRNVEVAGMDAVDAAWDTSLVLRSYEMPSDSLEKMELEDITEAIDISEKFPEAGFPKGATAIYQPNMEKLFIRNTRENLLIIEEVLSAMDVANLVADVEQVEIEAKFVEISEGTLEELGFQWQSIPGETYNVMGDVTMPGGQYLFDDALRGGANNGVLPFTTTSALGAGSVGAGSGGWTAMRFEDTFSTTPDTLSLAHRGSSPFDVVISALDQSTGADVLSAPRVVTKSGEEAVIRVGELHYYPEVYEVGAGGATIMHVQYEDWEERLLGVELTVTPQVDGDQIEMELNPKILELQGWQTYDIAARDSAYTWYQASIKTMFTHDAIQSRLPIFRKREILTEVTIANGATFAMGGLINEKIESFEDKVPLLGSIPFVGRLFRNEGERAIKRNLIMFVTANRVEPNGRISSTRSFE